MTLVRLHVGVFVRKLLWHTKEPDHDLAQGRKDVRIAILHTLYRERGGEDAVVEAEVGLLRGRGHAVETMLFRNHELEALPAWRQAARALWNREAVQRVREVVRRWRPTVVHVHNTFPAASPAVIRAAAREGAAVVATLHNYRLGCVNALLFRDDRVCEACLGRMPWRGVLHGCWRGRPRSAVVAAMLGLHRALGTWEEVDVFIALTDFARDRLVAAGLPPDRIRVKPNFVDPDPGPGGGGGGFALFVGRLSPEKGIGTLLRAWSRLGGRMPLRIVGDGPLRAEVERAASAISGVEYLGPKPPDEVCALMGEAAFLLFPSECYENFPRVLAEAFAKGLPVVCSGHGSHGSLVEHGRTGLHFRPGDPEDLAAKVEWMLTHPERVAEMRREARREYEEKYTAERNYEMLMQIYEEAIRRRRG